MTYIILAPQCTRTFTKLYQSKNFDIINYLRRLEFERFYLHKLNKKYLFLYRLIIYIRGTICFPSQRKAFTMLSYLLQLSSINTKLHFSFKAVEVSK